MATKRKRRRRNPRAFVRRTGTRRSPRVVYRRPTRRRAPARRRRARGGFARNPLVPTNLLQRGLAIAAGFIAAPRLAALIPIELPGGKIGQYIKEFLVVSVGSQVIGKALGRKYGQALFAGGVIHIGVDMLQSYVTPFGSAVPNGVSYYMPPDSQLLGCGNGGMGVPLSLPPESFASGSVGRFSSRFS